MAGISFEKSSSTFTILNPFDGFASEIHTVEVRRDPLLGDTSIYNPFLKDKARVFFGENDGELIKKIADDSVKNCIFCGENVMEKTARYPSDLLPQGRIRQGEAVLFANLFSVGAYHPVVALGGKHFLKLSEFTPQLLADGFKAAQEFLVSLHRRDPTIRFAAVCANYLLPAGASLVHPHLQMLATPLPYSYHKRIIDACRLYYEKEGTSWFDDFIDEEMRINERFIVKHNRWNWLSAFSPMGSNEVMAIHEKESGFAGLSDGDLQDLAFGIARVLLLYERLGHLSFNYALYSVRNNSDVKGFRCLFKIISRQNLCPNYRNDDYFLQKMLQTELILNLPEELAAELRKMF